MNSPTRRQRLNRKSTATHRVSWHFSARPATARCPVNARSAGGLQPQRLGGASVWVLPNPSGRNLAFSLEQLVEAYQSLREAIAPVDPAPLIS